MRPLFETVTDLCGQADVLGRRAHGVIEAAEGRFRRVVLRPLPTLVSLAEVLLLGKWYHRRRPADRCLLYYDQPCRFRNFLVVKYVVSGRGTTYGTLGRTLDVLDEIARQKKTDALLCHLSNGRITPRLMTRRGWEPHCPSGGRGHYIKRFYGEYPAKPEWITVAAEPAAV
ncbi:MAG: hypothetical protein ABIK89_22270 [Planctomycetota bacterium]